MDLDGPIELPVSEQHKIFAPPEPNMRMRIGRDSNTYFMAYCHCKPNRFQRWMLRNFFAMYIEDVE